MRISSRFFSSLSMFLLTAILSFGQNSVNNSTTIPTTYTILKGEGLYRISVKLGTTMDELLLLNPTLQNGFKEGQVIKVPSNSTVKSSIVTPRGDSKYILHTVDKGQTLYSISQKYDVPIEIIISHNAGVENGLVEGSVIKIPKDTQSDVTSKQRSNDYIYYAIEPKMTLYGISKKYSCSVDDLIEANPGLSASGLKVGSDLRIPKFAIEKKQASNSGQTQSLYPTKGESYIVTKRDDLSSIALRFSRTEDAIIMANPLVDFTKLVVGTQIVIPIESALPNTDSSKAGDDSEENAVAKASKSRCGNYQYRANLTTFKIAILLPFAANENLSSVEASSVPLSSVSKIFIEYYEGALLALDKLKSKGLKIDCYVYDTWPDSTKIVQILSKPEMKQMNLIFGPAYAVNLGLVSDFAKSNKIPLIYPLSSKNYELAENPYLFQINSNDSVIYDNVGKYFASQTGAKIVALISKNSSLKERDILEKVRVSYNKVKAVSKQSNSFVEVVLDSDKNIDKILASISLDKSNLIFIPSEKESDVASIVNSVHGILKKTTATISVFGMPEWLKYSTVNADDIHASNTYIFTRSALDYYSANTQSFIKEYRMIYKSEPLAFSPYFQYGGKNPNYSRYGILGYDLTYYFVSALMEFGPQFQFCLNGFNPPLIESNFIFKRVGNWGGFYDDGLFLVHFKPDFKIERITLH